MNRACEALSLLMCTLALCVTATGSKAAEAENTRSCQRCPVKVCTDPINQCNHDGPEHADPTEKQLDESQDGLASEQLLDDTNRNVAEDYFYEEDYYGDYGSEYGYSDTATTNESLQSESDVSQVEAIEEMDLRSGYDDVYDDAVYGAVEPTSDDVVAPETTEDNDRLNDVQYDYGYDDSNYGEDYDSYQNEGSSDADDQHATESNSDNYVEDTYEDFDYEGNWYDDYQNEDFEQASESDVASEENAIVEEYQPYDYDTYDYDSYDYDQYWYDQVEDDREHEADDQDRVAEDADQKESVADQLMERLHTVADLPRKAVDFVMESKYQLSPSLWYSQVIDRLQQAIDKAAANQPVVTTPVIERHALDADFGFADEYDYEEWDCFAPDFDSRKVKNAPVVTSPAVKSNSDDQTESASLRYDRAVMLSIAKLLDHTGSSLRHVSQQLTRVAQADGGLVEAKACPSEGVEQR